MPVPLPSWLNRPDFIAAMEAGNAAGVASGNLALQRDKLNQQALETNLQVQQQAQAQTARAAQAQADMAMQREELQVKQQLARDTALREQARADIDHAEEQTRIGISQGHLANETKRLEAEATDAARKHQRDVAMIARRAELKAQGMTEIQANVQAMMENPETPPTAVASMFRTSQPRPTGNATVVPVPDQPGLLQVTTPDGRVEVRNKPVAARQQGMSQRDVFKLRRLDSEVNRLQKLQAEGDKLGLGSVDPAKVGPGMKGALAAYQKRAKDIEALNAEIKALETQIEAGDVGGEAPAAAAPSQVKRLRWTPQGFEPIQ